MGKEATCNAEDAHLIPGLGRFPWRRKWQLAPIFLPKISHGQRSQVGRIPKGCKELNTTERLSKKEKSTQVRRPIGYFCEKLGWQPAGRSVMMDKKEQLDSRYSEDITEHLEGWDEAGEGDSRGGDACVHIAESLSRTTETIIFIYSTKGASQVALVVMKLSAKAGGIKDAGSMPWQPTPVFFPGESYGQRRLEGYSL